MGGDCSGHDTEGEGESRALTFIARDQCSASGLEVGRDDVTEAMGQDVVCFIVDVLPAVGTGLEDRVGFRAGTGGPRRSQSRPRHARWFCGRTEEQKGRKPPSLPPSPPGTCSEHQQTA